VLRNAWSRVFRKQLLLVYPLLLGLLGYLSFFAVYSALGGEPSWNEFARAAGGRHDFLKDNLSELTEPGLPLLVALMVAAAVVLLTAAIRAPYYRAIVGMGYPLGPRSWGELGRLSLFFFIYLAIFELVPLLLPSADDGSLWASIIYLVFLVVAALLMFADYVVVFEERGPMDAALRSASLVRRGWMAAVGIFLLGNLILSSVALVYADYYEGSERVFLLFPFTEILINALLFVFFDVFLLYIYRYLAR
jgi:hypothetical protein